MATRRTPKKRPAKPQDAKRPLGTRIRELRERRGLTQQQLSSASGVSKVFLGTVERGEKAATVETLEKLAHGLKVEIADLFAFDAADVTTSPADLLGRRVAALVAGHDEAALARIERLVRLFVEPVDRAIDGRMGPRRRRPR